MNPIALLGIFLLFFIGLAMFCKVPVAYSIGSATLAVVVAAGMKSSTICTVAFSGLDRASRCWPCLCSSSPVPSCSTAALPMLWLT